MNGKTTAEFVEQASRLHGDKYDYSLVSYFNSVTKVVIVCSIHGPFRQAPDTHLRGSGCPRCGWEKPRRPRARETTAGFVASAVAKHPDANYDYSLVEYVNKTTPVTIVCPVHGPFQQKPYVHLSRSKGGDQYCGCPLCGRAAHAKKRLLAPDDVIRQATAVHDGRYDYSRATYRGMAYRMTILCPDHGAFQQSASNHLAGQGCRQCQIDNGKLTAANFLARAAGVYDQVYSYPSLDAFVTATDRVRVQCPDHGVFDVNSRTHLEGRSACPGCTQSGSRYERRIQRYLEAAGIEYSTQWTHPTLRYRNRLRYDFMLPAQGTLIEFDGAFHFKPIQMPGQSAQDARRAYQASMRRDRIKNEWAAANGWSLLRLSSPNVELDLRAAGIVSR